MIPVIIGLMIAADIPIAPDIPNIDPVYLGPISAWFTLKPPTHTPVQILTNDKQIINPKGVSCIDIKKRKIADPKKPIEFTDLRTLITL